MTKHILDFVELSNSGEDCVIPDEYDAFQYSENLRLPIDANGQREGMVSRHVDQKDFQPIEPGQVVMETFAGEKLLGRGIIPPIHCLLMKRLIIRATVR